MAAALQDEENRAVEVSDRLVQSNLSPIEIITLDDSTDAPTLQPPSSPLNVRHQPLKATNQTPIATSPTENRLMEVEASEQTREQSISHKFGWNISATNRAPWPLPGSSNSRVQVPTAPAMSPTIESLVREVMTYCDASTIYDASTSTIYRTTASLHRPIDEPSTSLHLHLPTWSNKPYSSYQRGHDWPHQKTHSEEEAPPQAYPTQFNPIQANQRNLENQPQKPFTEQNRPSVLRSVKNKLPVLNINPVLIKENRSKTNGPSYGTDSNEVIMKYIHKKFSRRTQCLDRPSTSLSMEFDETFKDEESRQDMDNMRSSTALGSPVKRLPCYGPRTDDVREKFHSSSILINVSPSERYVNCSCSLDFIDKVSQGNLFRVLRERLPLVDRLHKIIYASHVPFGAELMFSVDDLKQWKVIYWNLRSNNFCIFLSG